MAIVIHAQDPMAIGPLCGTVGNTQLANIGDEATVTCRRCMDRIGVQDLQPTRDDLFAAAEWTCKYTNLVPTAWGATATGKTYGFNLMAERNNAGLVTVLLSQHTPDEIAGFQTIGQEGLIQQEPAWFREAQQFLDDGRNVVILFDELGLAPKEVRGAMFTFMRDRHLHGHRLRHTAKQNVYVVAATNPAEFTATYLSRCLMFHVPADRSYLRGIAKGWIAERATGGRLFDDDDPMLSNNPPPRPRTVNAASIAALSALDMGAKSGREFWQLSETARGVVLAGLLPPELVDEVLRRRDNSADALLEDPKAMFEVAKSLPTPEAVTLGLNILQSLKKGDKMEAAAMTQFILGLICADVDKYAAYIKAPKTQEMLDNLQRIPAEVMDKALREAKAVYEENGEVKGIIREEFERQVPPTK